MTDMTEARERLLSRPATERALKQALVNHFSREELGLIFDEMPAPEDSTMPAPVRTFVSIVGDAWADYDQPERF